MTRVALIVTDNILYKNDFINRLVKSNSDNIVLLIELNFKHPKTDKKEHINRYLRLLGLKGVVYIGILTIINFIRKAAAAISNGSDGYSVRQIASKNGIAYFRITDVNSPDTIRLLESQGIDYIFNSGNQIYRKPMLEAFPGRILNRHTSLLPAYGGISPIFWQMLHGTEDGGVTLHGIDSRIDDGEIAYQARMRIDCSYTLFQHYRMGFQLSLDLCNQAISDLNKGVVMRTAMTGLRSYYSWPELKAIKAFRKKGLRIC